MIGPVIFPRKSTEIADALDDFFFQCVYYGRCPTSGSALLVFESRASRGDRLLQQSVHWDPM